MNKAIKCGKLFNSIDGSVSDNQVVLVEGERTAESVLCCAAVALLYVRPLIKATRSGFREILPRRHR